MVWSIKADVIDGVVIRMEKAYPVYDQSYKENLSVIRAYLDTIPNLQLIGRNGQHRYNNQDHSMLTAVYAARNLCGADYDLWDVNVDGEYHEEVNRRGAEINLFPKPCNLTLWRSFSLPSPATTPMLWVVRSRLYLD